jgi:hypothetical protein
MAGLLHEDLQAWIRATREAEDGQMPAWDAATHAWKPTTTSSGPHASSHASAGQDPITPASIGALADAPSDGSTYGRKNGAWAAAGSQGGLGVYFLEFLC